MQKHLFTRLAAQTAVILGLSLVVSPLSAFAFTQECTGGTITHSGGNTIHSFTASGTLDCTSTGGGTVRALVVAGGGTGQKDVNGAGGGAGGLVATTSLA